MKYRPECYKCGGHITNKVIIEYSKRRYAGIFVCKECQKEINKKYGCEPKHGKSFHNASNKEYWKSIKLREKELNGEL